MLRDIVITGDARTTIDKPWPATRTALHTVRLAGSAHRDCPAR